MKILIFLVTFIFSINSFAWTLMYSDARKYKTSTSVDVYYDSQSCPNAGLTASSIQTLTEEAVDTYWNSVATTSLKLNSKSILNTGLGTSPSSANALNYIAGISNNSILVICADNITSNTTLAQGTMNCVGDICVGAVLLNNKSGTVLASVDHETVVATLAHEIGHAIGIGHTSVKYALMYYNAAGVTYKSLSQDDIDAVTYLYPNNKSLGGIGGACGSIDLNHKNKSHFLFSLLMGLMLLSSLYWLTRKFRYFI
jgi:predicted Zn-dependent protease